MPTAYIRGLNQEATYWAPGTPDAFSKVSFDFPIVIKCRWEDKTTRFRNAAGEDSVSEAVVYVDRRLEFKGYLMLGDMLSEADYLNPKTLIIDGRRAREIRWIGSTPSVDATRELHKVYL